MSVAGEVAQPWPPAGEGSPTTAAPLFAQLCGRITTTADRRRSRDQTAEAPPWVSSSKGQARPMRCSAPSSAAFVSFGLLAAMLKRVIAISYGSD